MPALRRREQRCERARLRHGVERRAGPVHALGERRAQVRRAEGHDVPDALDPVVAPLGGMVAAERATSPPIEWPITAMRSTSTGHSATRRSSRSASSRPFSEMCRPVL